MIISKLINDDIIYTLNLVQKQLVFGVHPIQSLELATDEDALIRYIEQIQLYNYGNGISDHHQCKTMLQDLKKEILDRFMEVSLWSWRTFMIKQTINKVFDEAIKYYDQESPV